MITVGDRTYELNTKPVVSSLHRLRIVDGKRIRERVAQIEVGPREEGVLRFSVPRTATSGNALVGTVLITDPKMRGVELRARVPSRSRK